MIKLTISSSLPQFTQFLLERCGIEGNILTVDEARAAARHGSTWNDVVGVWKKRCPLEPEDTPVQTREPAGSLDQFE